MRFVGVSGYPMKIFRYVLDRTDLDVILSYNHYTLQNTMLADLVPYLKAKGVGHHERRPVLGPAADQRAAAALAQGDARGPRASAARPPSTARRGASTSPSSPCSISIANEDMATCVVGSANPENVRKWVEWADAADRPDAAGRGAGDPQADPQLVLHRRPAREQRPARRRPAPDRCPTGREDRR